MHALCDRLESKEREKRAEKKFEQLASYLHITPILLSHFFFSKTERGMRAKESKGVVDSGSFDFFFFLVDEESVIERRMCVGCEEEEEQSHFPSDRPNTLLFFPPFVLFILCPIARDGESVFLLFHSHPFGSEMM